MLEADTFTEIGATHYQCQDSARVHVYGDHAIAVLCDGCSSAINTEIGARLLAWNISQNPGWDSSDILAYMDRCIPPMGLHKSSFYSTILRAIADQQQFNVSVWGDGFVIARKVTGGLRVVHLTYPEGAPAYLAYAQSSKDLDAYQSQFHGGICQIDVWDFEDGQWSLVEQSTSEGVVENIFTFTYDEYDLITLSSDGIETFKDVEWKDIVPSLCGYKNLHGEFVRRRVSAFLKREHSVHGDDISFASIARIVS